MEHKAESIDRDNDLVGDIFKVNEIAPFSEQNLVSTNLFGDEAIELFMDSLTYLEKMVITPVHMQVIIMRLRTNNVAFSSHGVICYPLKSILQAKTLPWCEFNELPFIVMKFQNKLGNFNEATVDIEKILKAKELLTREMICPVYGSSRPFNRFCNEIPFE